MNAIDKAVSWAVGIAEDDSHGYDQINRSLGDPNGTDYDCSSLVCTAWQQAGIKVIDKGATYTGNMRKAFLACGFKEVDIKTRRKGDVLLNEAAHCAMMIDDKNLVHASINELGKAVGGKRGDQTKKEICVRPYYNYSKGWDCCLRYMGDTSEPVPAKKPTEKKPKGYKAKVIAQSGLNCRENSNINSKILFAYNYGAEFEILSEKDGWGQTDKGWVSLEWIKKM